MTYSKPVDTNTTESARAVADEGWCVAGVLDGLLPRRLLRAVDEVAWQTSEADTSRDLHVLSGLAQHPDLAAIVDWPPPLALAVELFSPNVYITHSQLDVQPPHPSTSAHRWHRDNSLMGPDMRLRWRDQPRMTLKVAVYFTDIKSADDGGVKVVPRGRLDVASRYPTEEQPDGVPVLGPAGRVAVFDARLWHRRRDDLGRRVRRATFVAYGDRWLTWRDTPFENVLEWAGVSPIRVSFWATA